MSIEYALYKNHLTPNPEDYSAHVQLKGSADFNAIINRMAELGSTVNRADSLAVFEDSFKAIESLLLEGFRVNMGGLVQLYPSIKGIFNGITDSYDSSRHRLDIAAVPGPEIRKKIIHKASIKKIKSSRPSPSLLEFKDLGSDSSNMTITPGNIGTINGSRLKYDQTQDDEGIFLIRVSDRSEQKISAVQKNKPSELVFLIPAGLIQGDLYSIEVRSRARNDTKPRTGTLLRALTAS